MQSIRFTVPGKPVGKARPRVTTRGGHARAYTPERTKEFEDRVRQAYIEKYGYTKMAGTLKVDIIAFFEPPVSTPKKNRWSMINGFIPYYKKPDIDNVIKSVMDALNGVAYYDDRNVIAVYGFKCYGEYNHTDVVITEIGGRYVYEF